eukprot:COSAG06_NODE_21514_length_754_cov_1.322137_2_plen_44_part_01
MTTHESSSTAAAKPADTDEKFGASEGGDEYTVEDILDCRRDKKN